MFPAYELVSYGLLIVLSVAGLLLLLLPTAYGRGLRSLVRRLLARLSPAGDAAWLDWRLLLLVGGIGYALTVAFDIAYGLYSCSGRGPSDILALALSGRALWTGGNPFTVANCGAMIDIPYGLAAIVLDAVGSLGGPIGIAIVWGLVALLLIPLVWTLAGPDRRYVTLCVATSILYLPLVTAQIDGATNVIVPVTVLLVVVLARTRDGWAAAIGGFLATARFPTMFPLLGIAGRYSKRWRFGAIALGVFLGATALSFAAWGRAFFDPVFLNQLGRRSFSLNLWGILIQRNALPGGPGVAIAQIALTLALVVAVFFRARTVLGAAAITLTGVALVTQFLSFNILVGLLPVALLGARPRWWLWAISIVAAIDYDLAFPYFGQHLGNWAPYNALDLVLTLLLIALFVDLWRRELAAPRAAATTIA
jgi:hypothetical protein